MDSFTLPTTEILKLVVSSLIHLEQGNWVNDWTGVYSTSLLPKAWYMGNRTHFLIINFIILCMLNARVVITTCKVTRASLFQRNWSLSCTRLLCERSRTVKSTTRISSWHMPGLGNIKKCNRYCFCSKESASEYLSCPEQNTTYYM